MEAGFSKTTIKVCRILGLKAIFIFCIVISIVVVDDESYVSDITDPPDDLVNPE